MFELSRYEVTGVQPVLGHAPGSFFEDDLEPGLERRLIERGAIREVERPPVPTPTRLDDPQPNLPPAAAAEPTTNTQQEE